MTDAHADVEARTVASWFAAARQQQSDYVGVTLPRVIAENARTMAAYMNMTASAAAAAEPSMAFWQMFLPSVLGRDPANFTDVHARLPHSFDFVRRGVAAVAAHRQLVFAAFHMAAFPLVAAMLAKAVFDVHGDAGHVLVARRNMAFLKLDSGRWVSEVAQVISTDARGLRQLHAGLRSGSIRRLLILVDGPHRPGPGTHPLTCMAPTLGFKTALLRKLSAMQIPVLPLTHAWSEDRLELEWQPLLPDASVAATATLIESLLRRHPEQWLNWSAARAAATR
ncbi:MAG TPA: hypothetical protein VG871_13990 [Vicinamibacterales bacterium]|nr:hypothetical protein [Vicinamibacterales bacterium]